MTLDPVITDIQKAFVTGRHCLPPPPFEREFAVLGTTLDPRDTEPCHDDPA
jgi:hypothetical protein